MRKSADDGGADGNGGVGSNEDGDGGANEDGGDSGDGGGAEFSKGTAWSGVEFSRGLKVGSFYSLSRAELADHLGSRVGLRTTRSSTIFKTHCPVHCSGTSSLYAHLLLCSSPYNLQRGLS